MKYYSPKYSFVQFGTTKPVSEALPIVTDNDLQFQFIVLAESVDEYLTLLSRTAGDAVVSLPDTATLTTVTLCRLGYAFIWSFSGAINLVAAGIELGECFSFDLDITGAPGTFHSNDFVRTADVTYTSLLTYYNDENSNDFYYCCDQRNKIRLPLYLDRPQFTDDEESYAFSDGSRKLLKSITSKTFEGSTDRLNDATHEKVKVMLGSDHVNIVARLYTGDIMKTDTYSIKWPDKVGIDYAPATFRVFQLPFNVRNSDCDECLGECDLVVTGLTITQVAQNPGDPVIYMASYTLSGAATGFIVQYLVDDSIWSDATVHSILTGGLVYDIGRESDTPHSLRVIPLCAPGDPGLSASADYSPAGSGLCPATIDTLNLCEDCGIQFTVVWQFIGDAPADWEVVVNGGTPDVFTDAACGGPTGSVRFYNYGTGYLEDDYTVTVRGKCGANYGTLATITEHYDPAGTGGTGGGGSDYSLTYDNGDNGFKLKSVWKSGAMIIHDGGLEDGNPNPLVYTAAIDTGTYTVSIQGHPGIAQCFIICPTNALNRKVNLDPITGANFLDQTVTVNGNVSIEY